jgi:DNA primase
MAKLKEVKEFYRCLQESPEALDFYNKRGITPELIKEFKLGYCPKHKEHWAKGRIAIPIFDSYGRFLDFGTRTIQQSGIEKKWKNGTFSYTTIGSTEKNHHLYNLNKAKKYIIKQKYVIITEGYFDVITAWKNNIKNIVATCGTAFSFTHFCLLARYCELLVFAYDADEGGRKAILKIEDDIKDNLGMINIELPQGYDLDDYLKEYTADDFYRLIKDKLTKDD